MSEEIPKKRLSKGDRIGKYEILELIASGGMGTVYKARDVDLDRVVALKVLPPSTAVQPKMLDRFRREARAGARLHHENIVTIYEFSQQGGVYFLAMEFVPGIDLQEYIEKRNKLPTEEARQIILQAARALAHAHDQKIVHRDVKPSNFLLTRKDGRLIVKLTDMGLALQPKDEDFRLTREGTTVGTIDYMAPEQARDSGSADIRSDIYSLGCTFYHLLAGTAPFARGTMAERLLQHLQDEAPDVRNLNQDVPPGYVAILQRMLAKRPDERYQNPQELIRDLEDPTRVARSTSELPVARAVPAARKAPPRTRSGGPPIPVASVNKPVPTPPPPSEPAAFSPADDIESLLDPLDEPDILDLDKEPPPPRKVSPGGRSGGTPIPVASAGKPAPSPPAPTIPEDDIESLLRPLDEPEAAPEPPPAPEPVQRPAARPRRERPTKPARSEAKRDPPRRERETRGTRDMAPAERQPPARDKPSSSSKTSGGPVPAWAVLAGGGAALVFVLVIAVGLALRAGPGTRKSESSPKGLNTAQVPSVVPTDPNAGIDDPDKPRVAGNAAQMGPFKPVLPAMYKPALPWDPAVLRRDFHGPLDVLPQPPAGTPVLRVSRGGVPGPNSFRSLAEALAAVPEGAAIIEIQDRGPLFIGNLPALDGRDVWLRGAAGFRPLLAWEPPRGAKEKAPAVLFNTRRGQLVLDGLDIVGKWSGAQAEVPTTLFLQTGGKLQLRNCTVSLSGSQPPGIVLARLKRGDDDPVRVRITGCYARGIDLAAVAIEDTSADVLIDDSLVAGSTQPLVSVAGKDDDEATVRIARSTLATAQGCLRVERGNVGVSVLLLDSILARNDSTAPGGDLVRFGKGAEPQLKWRVVNSVYAGWKQLLASDAKSIDGNDLNAWRAYCSSRDGDRATLETWPNFPSTQLEDLPATVFMTYDTPVAFAATNGQDPIGVLVGRLPPDPPDWLKQTFDRPPLVLTAVADPGVPAIDITNDGLYHGERIELPPKADLGVTLAALMKGRPRAARIVFHVAGSGEHPMSPMRVKGISELALYFEPPKEGAAPITLTVKPLPGLADRAALIETERCSLELVGAHVRYDNSKTALIPAHLVKVAGGKLIVHNCRLTGPLGKAPDAFRGLLALSGSGSGAAGSLECRISDSVLLSGKGILRTSGVPVQLSVRHSLVFALGDALVPEHGALNAEFEENTWVLRHALIAPRSGPDGVFPVGVKAAANYFTDPFGDVPGQSTLLHLPEGFIARGLLTWHGKGNAFDRRLDSFATVIALPLPGKLMHSDWLALWGRTGEQDALIVEPGAAAKTPLNVDAPQLDRLALPRTVRPEPGNPEPGANLVRLGVKKKG